MHKESAVQRYVKKHKKLGLCEHCPRPALPGLALCAYHKAKRKKNNAIWYQKNKEAKKAKTKNLYYDRLNSGLCVSCGTAINKDFDTQIRCSACVFKNNNYRAYIK